MHILTRAEEEVLFKTLKANALKECDPVVKGTKTKLNGLFVQTRDCQLMPWIDFDAIQLSNLHCTPNGIEFVECTHGKLVTVLWGCRAQHKAMNKCLMAL